MIETEMFKAGTIGAREQTMVRAAAHAASRLLRIGALIRLGILIVLGQLSATARAQESVNVPITEAKSDATTQTASAETDGYFVTGVVTDDETGLPIADANLQLTVPSEPDAAKRVLKGTTNADGRYHIAVPLGTVRLWYPSIKPGYWISEPSQNMVSLTTSLEQPIASHSIRVKSAPAWKVKYLGPVSAESNIIAVMEIPDDNLRRKVLARETWSSQAPLNQWVSSIDADGNSAFTQIGDSGKLIVSVFNAQAELIVDVNFDNARVSSAVFDPATQSTLIRDAEGRTARLYGGTVETHDGVPTIVFAPRAVESKKLKVVGTVLGANSKPLSDVEVRVAIQNEVGGGVREDRFVLTRPDGSFELQLDVPSSMQSSLHKVSANFRKAGLVITDSNQIKLTDNDTTIDVGTTELQPGHSIQVKTVDGSGKQLAGCFDHRNNGVSQYFYQARTEANGEATLNDLPADVVRISASHGQLTATTKLVVDDSALNQRGDQVASPPTSTTAQAITVPTPVAIGKPAPEWNVQAWTDGKSRSLSDIRGKVTVLEFWAYGVAPV